MGKWNAAGRLWTLLESWRKVVGEGCGGRLTPLVRCSGRRVLGPQPLALFDKYQLKRSPDLSPGPRRGSSEGID